MSGEYWESAGEIQHVSRGTNGYCRRWISANKINHRAFSIRMSTKTTANLARTCWLLAGVLLLFGSGRGAAAERFNLGRTLQQLGYEAIELRRTGDNHLFLFGKVDGRRRSCLVDTGWSFTAISTNTAGRLRDTNRIGQLTLGRVVLTNEAVRVQDLRVNGQPTAYDMVLGCDFLLRHHAVIDVAGRRLYLRRTELTTAERAHWEQSLRGAGLERIEMNRREPLALTCRARVNGQPVELLVDSGAAWSCLDTRVAQSLNLRAAPSLNRMMGPGATGARNFAVADLRAWQLGEVPMRHTSVAVFSLAEWGLGPDGKLFSDVGGILGGSELVATRMVIDCGGMNLWSRPRR